MNKPNPQGMEKLIDEIIEKCKWRQDSGRGERMTNQQAFYIIGNIPIPTDDTSYDICQYQEAKAIALECIQKVDDLSEHDKRIKDRVIDEVIKHFEEHHILVFDKNEIVDELEQLKE